MLNIPPLAGAGALPLTPPAKFMTGLAAVEKLKPPPEPPAAGAAAAAVPAPKLKPPAAGAAVGAAADPKLKVEAAVEAATGAGAGACPKLNNGFEDASLLLLTLLV